jgi:3-oxoacyl-[acyl-carrier protein] reductase
MPPTGSLAGRIALITGAGRGIGAAVAAAYAAEGALVVLAARSAVQLAQVAAGIRAAGGGALTIPADVGSADEVDRLVKETLSTLRRVDILCNNAAMLTPGPILAVDAATFDAHWRVNVAAPFLLCRALAPIMIEQGYGRIINVTSGLGARAVAPFGAYGVSKAALNHLTRVLATEIAGSGVLVNGLDPGVVRTAMNPSATASPESVVPAALHLATLPPDGPTGRFFDRACRDRGW